jgi:hypothetical protein
VSFFVRGILEKLDQNIMCNWPKTVIHVGSHSRAVEHAGLPPSPRSFLLYRYCC